MDWDAIYSRPRIGPGYDYRQITPLTLKWARELWEEVRSIKGRTPRPEELIPYVGLRMWATLVAWRQEDLKRLGV